jgi:hypothetical protein
MIQSSTVIKKEKDEAGQRAFSPSSSELRLYLILIHLMAPQYRLTVNHELETMGIDYCSLRPKNKSDKTGYHIT